MCIDGECVGLMRIITRTAICLDVALSSFVAAAFDFSKPKQNPIAFKLFSFCYC